MKSEVDERNFCTPDIADHIAPDRGVESPAMDEDEMHLRRGVVHAVALRGKARSSSALSRPSMSFAV